MKTFTQLETAVQYFNALQMKLHTPVFIDTKYLIISNTKQWISINFQLLTFYQIKQHSHTACDENDNLMSGVPHRS